MMDDAELKSLPVSLAKTQKLLTYAKHQKLGWVIIFGEKEQGFKDTMQNFLITMLAKLSQARFIRLKTFDEVLTHLRLVDQSIEWDQVNPEVEVNIKA